MSHYSRLPPFPSPKRDLTKDDIEASEIGLALSGGRQISFGLRCTRQKIFGTCEK